jgi:hypothetical protein
MSELHALHIDLFLHQQGLEQIPLDFRHSLRA